MVSKNLVSYSYFYNLPSTLHQFIWLAGVGLKFGSATIENDNWYKKEYKYQAQAFPTYQMGIKYRFDPGDELSEYLEVGVGVSFLIQVSLVSLTASDTIYDDIVSSIETDETKFSLGINLMF